MAINEDISTFLLPFKKADFCSLTDDQYNGELGKAKNRAKYILTTSCTASTNPGLGIALDEYNNDSSGQIQIALELLTAAEFLKRRIGYYSRANLLKNYESATREKLEITVEQFNRWAQVESDIRQEAWNAAYPYICEGLKDGSVGQDILLARNYDWPTLEKEYHQEIYPQYRNGKQYLNPEFVGSSNYW